MHFQLMLRRSKMTFSRFRSNLVQSAPDSAARNIQKCACVLKNVRYAHACGDLHVILLR